MRYLALATDYDGTLARDGVVDERTIESLGRLRQSGRKLILVTGRELPDLKSVFSRLDLFDSVVAENGALLYNPATREKRALAERPPEEFIESLRERGVTNISTGEVIVALWRPHEQHAINAIRDFGLELQVIFNKDAVMILPSGVNKMTGLTAALEEMKLSRHNVVGVGDAENDHAFLRCCECGVAVSNAIPALKERADLVTREARGDGVIELIGKILENDLADLVWRPERHSLTLGEAEGRPVAIHPWGRSLLICGQSGSGKSTFVAGFVERLVEKGYQICLVDPEGDYEGAPHFTVTGSSKHAPSLDHLNQILDRPETQVALNLVGVRMQDRAGFFARVMAAVQQTRLSRGRPHWLFIDEAHHMLPADWAPAPDELAAGLGNVALITVHPGHVAPAALKAINTMVVIGADPASTIRQFCEVTDVNAPEIPAADLKAGEALVWFIDSDQPPQRIVAEQPRGERHRHIRKYAEGQLEEERVFYFRGARNQLNLRAENLHMFLQMAAGVDDETWIFHLRQRDYSKWFRNGIKNPDIADRIRKIEFDQSLSAAESRAGIREAIEETYTAPV